MDERDSRHESRLLQQQWHGWASPIGMGLGLLCTGGFFVLLALGLSIMGVHRLASGHAPPGCRRAKYR